MDMQIIQALFEMLKSHSVVLVLVALVISILTQLIKKRITIPKKFVISIPFLLSLVAMLIYTFCTAAKYDFAYFAVWDNWAVLFSATVSELMLSVFVYNIYKAIFVKSPIKYIQEHEPLKYDLYLDVRTNVKDDETAMFIASTLYDLQETKVSLEAVYNVIKAYVPEQYAASIANCLIATFEKYQKEVEKLQDAAQNTTTKLSKKQLNQLANSKAIYIEKRDVDMTEKK